MSGANDILSEGDIKNAKSVISSSSVCVCQLEINPEVTHYTLSLAKKAGGEYCRKYNVQIFIWGMQRGGGEWVGRCLKHAGASTIDNQLLDGDSSHSWQIRETEL